MQLVGYRLFSLGAHDFGRPPVLGNSQSPTSFKGCSYYNIATGRK